MAVTAHITDNFGATTPTGGYVNESSHDDLVKKIRGARRERREAAPARRQTHRERGEHLRQGRRQLFGDRPRAFMADAFNALSAETTEFEEGEYCDFSVSGKIHSNVVVAP